MSENNPFASSKAVKDDKVENDFVGGSKLVTDIYEGVIKVAFITDSTTSKAKALTLIVNVNGTEHRETIWMSNGKTGAITYKDKDGNERNLPGYSQVNGLCMMLLGKEVPAMEVEELTFKIYDFNEKKEINQSVKCFSELHGLNVKFALQEQIVDKTEKVDSGAYEPTGETRIERKIVKFFTVDAVATLAEIRNFIEGLGGEFNAVLEDGDLLKAIGKMEDDSGEYAPTWLEKNKGKPPYDRSTGKSKSSGKSFEDSGPKESKKQSLFDD